MDWFLLNKYLFIHVLDEVVRKKLLFLCEACLSFN